MRICFANSINSTKKNILRIRRCIKNKYEYSDTYVYHGLYTYNMIQHNDWKIGKMFSKLCTNIEDRVTKRINEKLTIE